jgi:hypothetical protein
MSLSLEDRFALHDLLTRYAYAIDVESTEEDFLDMFTEDAVLISPSNGNYQGPEGVKRFRNERLARKGKIQVRHAITNFWAEGDSKNATVNAYFVHFKTQVDAPTPEGRQVMLNYSGSYHCTAKKIQGKWKFAIRTVYMDGIKNPDPDAVAALLAGQTH